MYSSGQNLLSKASLTFYNASGSMSDTVPLNDVQSGISQRTFLAGTAAMQTSFAVQADKEYVSNAFNALTHSGGGVCLISTAGFGTIDCVAWGTAIVPGAGPSEPAIPDDSSLARSITRGCNTLLEAGDDTGSSLADFAPALPQPEPNSAMATESTCPQTQIVAKPEAQTTDRTPRFTFSGGDDYRCKVDRSPFEECGTPFRPGRLELGRHKIQVKATQNDGSIDATPAKYVWKIVPR